MYFFFYDQYKILENCITVTIFIANYMPKVPQSKIKLDITFRQKILGRKLGQTADLHFVVLPTFCRPSTCSTSTNPPKTYLVTISPIQWELPPLSPKLSAAYHKSKNFRYFIVNKTVVLLFLAYMNVFILLSSQM